MNVYVNHRRYADLTWAKDSQSTQCKQVTVILSRKIFDCADTSCANCVGDKRASVLCKLLSPTLVKEISLRNIKIEKKHVSK